MKSTMLETLAEGGLHPANQLLAADPSAIRESLYHVIILKDGTTILLYHLQGDLDQVRTYLTGHKEVISYDVPENGNEPVYIHGRPLEPIREFFSLARSHGTVFETPIIHTDNKFKVMISEDEQTLHRIIPEVPPDIELTLLRKGECKPEENMIISLLTERQVEVLTLAAEEEYYETPRGATREKITT